MTDKDPHLEIKEKICETLEGNNIKEINVDGKIYFITLKEMELAGTKMDKWVCAYVDLKGVKEKEYGLDCQTFHDGDTYGVDTAHSWNDGMTLDEKRENAIEQIKRLIKSAK